MILILGILLANFRIQSLDTSLRRKLNEEMKLEKRRFLRLLTLTEKTLEHKDKAPTENG